MNSLTKIDICFLIVVGISLIYMADRLRKIREKKEKAKLSSDAQRYFLTICHKLLTKFGSESQCCEYYYLVIIENFLMVEHRQNLILCSDKRIKIMISARFEGVQIIDQKSDKVYGWSGFETYLTRFLGNNLVYSPQVKHLWEELQKQSVE